MCCVDYMRTDHACMYKDVCNMARVLLLMCICGINVSLGSKCSSVEYCNGSFN